MQSIYFYKLWKESNEKIYKDKTSYYSAIKLLKTQAAAII